VIITLIRHKAKSFGLKLKTSKVSLDPRKLKQLSREDSGSDKDNGHKDETKDDFTEHLVAEVNDEQRNGNDQNPEKLVVIVLEAFRQRRKLIFDEPNSRPASFCNICDIKRRTVGGNDQQQRSNKRQHHEIRFLSLSRPAKV
jgi:hypothetical protein